MPKKRRHTMDLCVALQAPHQSGGLSSGRSTARQPVAVGVVSLRVEIVGRMVSAPLPLGFLQLPCSFSGFWAQGLR